MSSLLVDTSVWINYLNGVTDKTTDLLHEYISDDAPLLTCPVIIQEVLQGIREEKAYKRVKQSLLSFTILDIDALKAAIGAADLYRYLRKKGITIRKSNDCLIAYYALTYNARLLHSDADFDRIASGIKLKTA